MSSKLSNEDFRKKFEERLTLFSLAIIELCAKVRLNRNLNPIADQLIRSGTSIGANIIEAKASGSKRDYMHYFQIALKSANESKYWLYLINKSCSEAKESSNLLAELKEIANIIAAGLRTMKGL